MDVDIQSLQKRYYLKEMEVNSLLEITQAINDNLPEEDLFRIYEFTIRANLNIGKLALYVWDEDWSCTVNFGTTNNFLSTDLPKSCQDIDEISDGRMEAPFDEFSLAIPVKHKSSNLAFVFVEPSVSTGEDINTTFLQAVSNLIIVAIENRRLTQRQIRQEAFRRELQIATEVQKLLFPRYAPPNKPGPGQTRTLAHYHSQFQ